MLQVELQPLISLALWATLATLCFAVVGVPLALWLTTFESRSRAFFSLLLAPACGMSMTIAAAVCLHFLGVPGRTVFALVLMLAAIGAVLMLWSKRPTPSMLIAAIGAIAAGTLFETLLNGLDYYGLSPDNYFPLTNSDTFSYFGLIDQIRVADWYEPIVGYLAGNFPRNKFSFFALSRRRVDC